MNKIDPVVAEMLHPAAMKGPMHALCRARSSDSAGGAWLGSAARTTAVRARAATLWI
jgi:hypothetical protein